jgi:rubredoxin
VQATRPEPDAAEDELSTVDDYPPEISYRGIRFIGSTKPGYAGHSDHRRDSQWAPGTNIFNTAHAAGVRMSLEMEHDCPSCGGSTQFWRTASTEVHLGTKTKWRCSECNFGFIQINGIDSTA